MKLVQRVLTALLPLALLVVAGFGGPTAPVAAPVAPAGVVPAGVAAFDDQTGQALAAWDCNPVSRACCGACGR